MKAIQCQMCRGVDFIKQDGLLVCQSCGLKYTPEEAQKLLIELSGKVEVKGISSVENDLKHGEQCLKASDWKAAFEAFGKAIEKQTDNFQAWYGCLRAITQEFKSVDLSWVQIDGIKGLKAILHNCIHFASNEEKQNIFEELRELIKPLKEHQDERNEQLKQLQLLNDSRS